MNKKYKFKFPTLWIIIAIVGALLAVGCLVLNVIRFLGFIQRNEDPGTYGYMSLVFALILSVGFIVLAIWAAVSSYYEITKTTVVLRWGAIKNVIDLSEVKEIKYKTVSKKLELTFTDDSYFLILINDEWKDSFISDIKLALPKIPFIQETEETK